MSSVRRSFDLPVELAARLSQRAFEDMTTQRAIVEEAIDRELGRLEWLDRTGPVPHKASRREAMDMTVGLRPRRGPCRP